MPKYSPVQNNSDSPNVSVQSKLKSINYEFQFDLPALTNMYALAEKVLHLSLIVSDLIVEPIPPPYYILKKLSLSADTYSL